MHTLQNIKDTLARLTDAELIDLHNHIQQMQHQRQLAINPVPSVKVGVIADLHGDLDGFQKALALFDNMGVSQILCTGDIVDRGAEADQIVSIIQERGIVCIAGNHDHTVVANQPKWRATNKPERLKELGRIISDETVAFLKTLPENARLTIAGQRILMGHGTPWSDVLGISPDTRQGIYQQLVDRYAADTDILILGHTHVPMRTRIGNMWILNPGSVYGITIRDSHTCAVLRLPDGDFTVYDLATNQPIEIAITLR